jgi:hypothetical protein
MPTDILESAATYAVHSGTRNVTSYDTGYEHSLEHLAEVKAMVDEADGDEPARTPAWLHALGITLE